MGSALAYDTIFARRHYAGCCSVAEHCCEDGTALDALAPRLQGTHDGTAPLAGTLGALPAPAEDPVPTAVAFADATSPLAGLSLAAVLGLTSTTLLQSAPLLLLLPGCVLALPSLLVAAPAVLLICGLADRGFVTCSASSSSSPASAAADSASPV